MRDRWTRGCTLRSTVTQRFDFDAVLQAYAALRDIPVRGKQIVEMR